MRGAHGNLGEGDEAAAQAARRFRHHIAAVEADLGAEGLKARQVQVHGAGSDRASARKGDARLVLPRQERPKHPKARAHLAHHVVRRGGVHDIAGGEMQRVALMPVRIRALAVEGGVHAMVAQDADEQAHVREVGHVLERDRVGREQACDHQRQSRVLGAAYRNRAVQALSAGYANSVHLVRRDRVAWHLPVERAKLSLSCKRRAPAPQGFELIRA